MSGKLYRHIPYWIQILKELEFPNAAAMAVLEHQERINGTGYPRKVSGDQISLYGKILELFLHTAHQSKNGLSRKAKTPIQESWTFFRIWENSMMIKL